jgi:hypothetical protein
MVIEPWKECSMAEATQFQPTVTTAPEPGVLDRAAAAIEAAVPKLPRHAGRRVRTALRGADGRLIVVCA